MINELFEYTKLNSVEQVLEYSKTDLVPLVQHLLTEYEIIYQNEGLGLRKECTVQYCFVEIDINKIIRVFQNLLDNAKKYAKRNSDIMIRVYTDKDWINVTIENELEDTAILDMERLFERFYKADVARTEVNGSGVGLAIVKRIVELHGGNLRAELENGRMVFQVKLNICDNKTE